MPWSEVPGMRVNDGNSARGVTFILQTLFSSLKKLLGPV